MFLWIWIYYYENTYIWYFSSSSESQTSIDNVQPITSISKIKSYQFAYVHKSQSSHSPLGSYVTVDSNNFVVVYKFVYFGPRLTPTIIAAFKSKAESILPASTSLDRIGNWKMKSSLDEHWPNFRVSQHWRPAIWSENMFEDNISWIDVRCFRWKAFE